MPVVSPASRYVNKFINEFCLQPRFKHLSIYKKWQAGKSSRGKTIFWTRSSLLKKTKTLTINYNIRNVKLCFIASFQFLSSNKKIVSLVYFANGAVTYYLTTENHTLFSYNYLNWNKNLRKFFYDPYWSPIIFLKKLIYISFVEILPGKKAQYCLSSGAQSRILNIDKKTHAVLIQLPSKVKKIISYYSCVFLGRLALVQKKRYHNTRSGYWRSLGKKPIVRGVAMNPVDHPHGGRGKSIRYPQTPWGKTTRFK